MLFHHDQEQVAKGLAAMDQYRQTHPDRKAQLIAEGRHLQFTGNFREHVIESYFTYGNSSFGITCEFCQNRLIVMICKHRVEAESGEYSALIIGQGGYPAPPLRPDAGHYETGDPRLTGISDNFPDSPKENRIVQMAMGIY
jgi:hypothetical protein